MSFKCPNKSFRSNPSQELSDWDLLVNKIGIRQAYFEYISNDYIIPSVDYIGKISSKNSLNRLLIGKPKSISTEEKEWFKAQFPDIEVVPVKTLIDNRSFGRFLSNGKVLLSDLASANTLRHEAFHIVTQLYLTSKEIKSLYTEVRVKFKNKNLTDLEVEEILAEDFANYKDTGKVLGNRPETRSLFKRLLNFIKSLVGLEDTQVKDIYDRLETGYYLNKQIVGNRQFTSLDKALPGKTEEFTKNVLDGVDYEFFDVLFDAANGFTPDKLFKVSNLSSSIYDIVRDTFIDRYEDAVEAKNEQAIENFRYILKNWDTENGVLTMHAARLKSLGVSLVKGENEKTGEVTPNAELTEDPNLISEESIVIDENKFERSGEAYQNANTISTKDLMYKQIKLLIATLPKIDQSGKKTLNNIGVPTLVEFNTTYNFLLKNLAGVSNFPDMVAKIKDLSVNKPEFKILLERLKGSSDVINAEQVLLQNQFRQDFDKNQATSYKTILRADGVIYAIDATRENTAGKVKEIWRNNLILVPGVSLGTNARLTISEDILEFKDNIDFLSKLGIKFSDETLPALEDNKEFSDAVLGIQQYIYKNNFDVTDLFGNESDAKGNLNTILDLEAKYTPNVTELSFISTEGKTVYSISLNNALSIIKNIINNAPDRATLFAKLPHLDSVYTKNSIWLSNMFDSNGIKKKGVNINLDLFDGLSTQDTEEKASKQTTKLSKGDKYVQDLNNLLLEGKTAYIRAADKSTEHSLSLSGYGKGQKLPVSIAALANSSNVSAVRDIFAGYFKDELQSIYKLEIEDLGRDLDVYGTNLDKDGKPVTGNAGKWRIFKDFPNSTNIKNTVDAKIAELKTSDKSPSEKQADIDALYKSLEKEVHAMSVEFLEKYTQELITEYAKYGVTKENKLGISKEISAKYSYEQIFRTLAVNDFINSVEQVKLFVGDLAFYKDLFKRTSAFTGTKKTVRYDQDWWNWLNTNKPRHDGKLSDGKIGVYVFEDSTQKSDYFNAYLQSLLDSGMKEDKAKEILSAYNKMDEADAQGYITLDEYREFFNGAGEFFSEDQYQYEINLMKKDRGQEYDQKVIDKGNPGYYFMPIKAQYAGPQDYAGLYAPSFHKYSLMPIQYSLVKGRNLEKLLDNMTSNKIGYSVFKSGSKVGTKVNEKGKANKFYTSTISGDINNENLQQQTIDYRFLGIQLDIAPKLKEKVIFGTQFRKLLFSNLFAGGIEQMKHSKRLLDEYSNIFRDIISTEEKKLIKELGLDSSDNLKSKDVRKLVELLKDEAKDRNLADNIIEALQEDIIDGEIHLKYNFDSMPNKDKINAMIMNLVNSRLIKQMMNGDAMIQGASTGFEKAGRRTEGSSELKFYRKSEDGKTTLPMEIKVPLTGEYKELLKTYGSIENINAELKKGDKSRIDKKLITWVGYRIPTQGLNSIEFMEIQEFLTESSGNLIVLPTEIVAKSGGDFDIDKLNIFRPWSNPKDDAQKKQNRIIDIAKEILEQEYNFNALVTPNSTSLLTDIVEELRFIEFKEKHPDTKLTLKEYTKKFKDELKNIRYTNQLKLPTKVDQFSKFLGGKAGVGIGAIHNTHHVLAQIANLSLNKYYVNEEGKKVPVILHFNHNKTSDGNIDIASFKDVKGNNNISEVISQIINASVDIAKDPFMFDLNMNADTLATYLYLVRTGIEFEQVAYFMRQPIIHEFLIESSKNKSVFLKAAGKNKSDTEIISGVFKKQKIAGQMISILAEDGLQQKYEKKLKIKLAMSDEQFERYMSEAYKKPRYDISTSELKGYLSSANQDSVAYLHVQLQMIKDYQNYKTQAGLLSDAINSVNHDTSGLGSNINSSRNKEDQKTRVKKTNFVNNIDRVYNETFVGAFDKNQFAIKAYKQFYHTQTPEIVKNNRFLLDYIGSKYTTEANKNKLSTLIENEFINYVIQNYGFTENIDKVVTKLFKGKESVAIKLLRLKNKENLNEKENELSENLLIKELYPLLADKKQHTETDNIKLYSKRFDKYTSDRLTESFREIKDKDPAFAKDLMDLGILQSGLNNSAITYMGIIPFEYYGDLVNHAFEEFDKKNGARDIYKFNQLFIRNNSRDSNVSFKAKELKLGKKEKKIYVDGVDTGNKVLEYDNILGNGMYGKDYDISKHVDEKPIKVEEKKPVEINNQKEESADKDYIAEVTENTNNDIEDETNLESKKDVIKVSKESQLNEGQKEAVKLIREFFDTPAKQDLNDNIFLLSGAGGTGKTFSMEVALSDVLSDPWLASRKLAMVAPTWNAVGEIKSALSNDAVKPVTLASYLAIKEERDINGNQKFVPKTEAEIEDLYEKTGVLPKVYTASTVVIDEASMVGGDGKSDSDLWILLGKRLKHVKRLTGNIPKILFMGDYAQIPPVGVANDADAFPIEYLKDRAGQYYNLSQNMRTNKSDIIDLMAKYRKNIDTANESLKKKISSNQSIPLNPNPFKERASSKNVSYVANKDKFIDKYVKTFLSDLTNIKNVVMVNFNNAQNDKTKVLVKAIREQLFGSKSENLYNKNELLLLNGELTEKVADKTHEFKNEARFIIHSDPEPTTVSKSYSQEVFVKGKGRVTFRFTLNANGTKVVLNAGKDEKGAQILITRNLVPRNEIMSIMGSYGTHDGVKGFMSTDGQIVPYALYLKVVADYPDFNYCYVVNSHKVQGSTYTHVFVDETNILAAGYSTHKAVNQLMYTAISRAKEDVTIYNQGNIDVAEYVQTDNYEDLSQDELDHLADREAEDREGEEFRNESGKLDNTNNDNKNLDSSEESDTFVINDAKEDNLSEYTPKMQLEDSGALMYSKSNGYFIVKQQFLGEARKLKSKLNENGIIVTEETRGNKKIFILNEQSAINFNVKSTFTVSEEEVNDTAEAIKAMYSGEEKEALLKELNSAKTDKEFGILKNKICK